VKSDTISPVCTRNINSLIFDLVIYWKLLLP
jgi:hypothetical protein